MKVAKWFKKEPKVPIDQLEAHECPNCETTFKGYYCPNCGQSDTEFDRPFGFVVYDFMGNFFSFDSRFFKTFWYLLSRPGFLTMEFLLGRRERYAPPFRTFIFLSFLLFLFLQILTNRALKTPLVTDSDPVDVEVLADSLQNAFAEAGMLNAGEETDSVSADSIPGIDLFGSGSLEERLAPFADEVDKKLDGETDPEKIENLRRTKMVLQSPRALSGAILKYLSWAFFAMLPVFALMLSLFYIRKKMNFIRHLVFSVHIHSFVFLVNIAVVVLALAWHLPGWVYLTAFIVVQLYIFMALRRFYGQGFAKTLFKFLVLGGIYSFCIIMASIIVVYNAFMAL